jgi:hypothetical protein
MFTVCLFISPVSSVIIADINIQDHYTVFAYLYFGYYSHVYSFHICTTVPAIEVQIRADDSHCPGEGGQKSMRDRFADGSDK